jgi:hypothetical protein
MNDDLWDMLNDITIEQQKISNSDEFWNSLSKEEQMMAFYSVCKRIYDGDIDRKGSYRSVLYQVFGFDNSSYTMGMDSGYMAIHNMLAEARDMEGFSKVTRVEVIGSERHFVKYFETPGIEYSLQDDNRTLKLFIDEETDHED